MERLLRCLILNQPKLLKYITLMGSIPKESSRHMQDVWWDWQGLRISYSNLEPFLHPKSVYPSYLYLLEPNRFLRLVCRLLISRMELGYCKV